MTEHDKAFYSDGYRTGIRINQPDTDKSELFKAIRANFEAIDDLTESLLVFANLQKQPLDCQKGCHWCCHQPVYGMSWEMEYLKKFIDHDLSEPQRDAIKINAVKKREKLKDLTEKQILNSKFPCPVLDENGACMAYPARPMACRIYLSSSLKSCKTFYDTPEDNSSFPALLDFPLRAGRMMNEGFKAALKTQGLNVSEYRIDEVL